MIKKTVELLAPAGSWEALEAAVNAGADAVYMGGRAFGARAYASNFDREEMRKAVYFAHMHRVRIYITVNTLVDDSELEELASYLIFLNNIDVDGIIVQDFGVVELARRLVPELPLHASTQMTVTNSAGVDFAIASGMERSVLARELSLKEIKAACAKDHEIEVFIHGALCICYSGQCLMSSLIGGRSGNRGKCAQPCRLPYKLVNEKNENVLQNIDAGQYLLSPKDMNTLEILPQLIEAGVTSYKIEGRMKRPEYVAVVVDAYRRAIDSYFSGNYFVPEQDFSNIEQIFNRDFTTAYMLQRPGRNMMSDRRPNNRGVLVGRVAKLEKNNQALIKLEKELHINDGLEFWVSVGGRVGTTVSAMTRGGERVDEAYPGDQVLIDVPKGVRLNDRVFRTLDNRLMQYAGKFFGPDAKRRIPVKARVTAFSGQPLTVELTDDEGNSGIGETEFIVETARKRPLIEEVVRQQLDRLGTTEYTLTELIFEHDDNVMVPLSEMNEARRLACEKLDFARLSVFTLPRSLVSPGIVVDIRKKVQNSSVSATEIITVHCDSLAKVEAALQAGAERILFGGDVFTGKALSYDDYRKALALTRSGKREFAVATPRIIKEEQLAYFKKLFVFLDEIGIDYLYINNLSLWPLAVAQGKFKLVADMSLNIFNSGALAFWQQQSACAAILSPELTMTQIGELAASTDLPLECIVQGHLEMMVSEYCVGGSFLGEVDKGNCNFNCRENLYLEDRKEAKFPLVMDQFCKMHVLNAYELSLIAGVRQLLGLGISSLRIDARTYDEKKIREIVSFYKKVVGGAVENVENPPNTTRGHYFRGVL